MSAFFERFSDGGGWIYAPMLAVSFLLYVLLGERLLLLLRCRDGIEGPPAPHVPTGDPARARASAEARTLAVSDALLRGLAVARALCAVLPLLGLLGTVTGMIGTMSGLTGLAETRLTEGASSGVALALVTTQCGLALAVPAVLLERFVRGRVEALVARYRAGLLEEIGSPRSAADPGAGGVLRAVDAQGLPKEGGMPCDVLR